MHIKEKVTGLWARRPRLSGTQGRALKGVTQFFAAMLVCTLIARGTAGSSSSVASATSPSVPMAATASASVMPSSIRSAMASA